MRKIKDRKLSIKHKPKKKKKFLMVCSTTAGSIYVMMQMVTDLVGQGFLMLCLSYMVLSDRDGRKRREPGVRKGSKILGIDARVF